MKAIPKVWFVDPGRPWNDFRRVHKVKAILIITIFRCDFPLSTVVTFVHDGTKAMLGQTVWLGPRQGQRTVLEPLQPSLPGTHSQKTFHLRISLMKLQKLLILCDKIALGCFYSHYSSSGALFCFWSRIPYFPTGKKMYWAQTWKLAWQL